MAGKPAAETRRQTGSGCSIDALPDPSDSRLGQILDGLLALPSSRWRPDTFVRGNLYFLARLN